MQLVGDGGLSHTDNLLQPAFGREEVFTHLRLPCLISFLVTHINLLLLTWRMMKRLGVGDLRG